MYAELSVFNDRSQSWQPIMSDPVATPEDWMQWRLEGLEGRYRMTLHNDRGDVVESREVTV